MQDVRECIRCGCELFPNGGGESGPEFVDIDGQRFCPDGPPGVFHVEGDSS